MNHYYLPLSYIECARCGRGLLCHIKEEIGHQVVLIPIRIFTSVAETGTSEWWHFTPQWHQIMCEEYWKKEEE